VVALHFVLLCWLSCSACGVGLACICGVGLQDVIVIVIVGLERKVLNRLGFLEFDFGSAETWFYSHDLDNGKGDGMEIWNTGRG
jgi:hypothetical protein